MIRIGGVDGLEDGGDGLNFGQAGRWLREILRTVTARPFLLTLEEILRVMLQDCRRTDVDEILRAFCATRQLPPSGSLGEVVRYEFALRLEVAIDYCDDMPPDELLDDDGDVARGLEQLLIGYWHDEGRGRWVWEENRKGSVSEDL